jgi:hypothetical protein
MPSWKEAMRVAVAQAKAAGEENIRVMRDDAQGVWVLMLDDVQLRDFDTLREVAAWTEGFALAAQRARK